MLVRGRYFNENTLPKRPDVAVVYPTDGKGGSEAKDGAKKLETDNTRPNSDAPVATSQALPSSTGDGSLHAPENRQTQDVEDSVANQQIQSDTGGPSQSRPSKLLTSTALATGVSEEAPQHIYSHPPSGEVHAGQKAKLDKGADLHDTVAETHRPPSTSMKSPSETTDRDEGSYPLVYLDRIILSQSFHEYN